MNCSLGKNSQGPVSNLVDFFFNGGVYEQKDDVKMPSKIEVTRNSSLLPLTTTNNTASFFSSLCSNLHCQMMLNTIIPQKKFLKDIPPYNTRKNFMSLFDNHLTVMGQLGDASTINTKLKDILMPFVPNHSLTNVLNAGFEKWQCLIPDREEMNTSDPEKLGLTEDCLSDKEAPCEDLLKSVGDSPEVMEFDEDDDIIFDPDISMDLSSCHDNDIDEGDDDDDDEDSDGDDIDFSDWDEVDKFSPCTPCTFLPPNESRPPLTLDNVMLKWDPGIEEELKNLPKTSKVSYKSWLDSSDDDDSTMLFEANRKWDKFYCSHSKRKDKTRIIRKKVSFAVEDKLLTIHQWEDCEGSRSGPWHRYALDRARFKRRIEECEGKLSKILQPQHRIEMSLMIENWKCTDVKLC